MDLTPDRPAHRHTSIDSAKWVISALKPREAPRSDRDLEKIIISKVLMRDWKNHLVECGPYASIRDRPRVPAFANNVDDCTVDLAWCTYARVTKFQGFQGSIEELLESRWLVMANRVHRSIVPLETRS